MNPEKNSNAGPLKSLRTYQGDIESVVGSEKTSITSIAIAEQKRNLEHPEIRNEPAPEEQSGPSFFTLLLNRSFVTIGIGLLLLGVIVVGGVFALRYFSPVPTVAPKTALLSFTKEVNLKVASTSRDTVIQTIVSNSQSFNDVINSILYFNTDTDSQTFMQTLSPNIPPALLRSLDTPYMMGIYSFSHNEPFIILTTTDYATAYTGLLKWEDVMPQDFSILFALPPEPTTTPYTFTDEAIANKDLRVLKNSNGTTVLLYTFLDKNTILIAPNEDVFSGLLGRFITSKLVR